MHDHVGCFIAVIFVIVIPWRYVFANYVMKPGRPALREAAHLKQPQTKKPDVSGLLSRVHGGPSWGRTRDLMLIKHAL